jgi:hypothetical protein
MRVAPPVTCDLVLMLFLPAVGNPVVSVGNPVVSVPSRGSTARKVGPDGAVLSDVAPRVLHRGMDTTGRSSAH